MADAFLEFVKSRRSYYPMDKKIPVSNERIEEIVKTAMLHAPTAFNSQGTRAVVLFGSEHEKLWDITGDILKAKVSEEQWKQTSGKMAMFKGAAGSVLFFHDMEVVESYAKNIPSYADKFPIWAIQAEAMLQFVVWTALEAEGLGANLQHYDPIIDEKVKAAWNIPASWTMTAQLVFGARTGNAGDKSFNPVEDRVKVYSS